MAVAENHKCCQIPSSMVLEIPSIFLSFFPCYEDGGILQKDAISAGLTHPEILSQPMAEIYTYIKRGRNSWTFLCTALKF